MSNINVLRQLIDVKNANKETENQRLVGEAIQKENTKKLFKPVTDKQDALNKQISLANIYRKPLPVIQQQQIQRQLPPSQQPIIEEVTEPLEYPTFDVLDKIHKYRVGNDLRYIYISSKDELDSMEDNLVKAHMSNVNTYIDKMIKTMKASATKPDKKNELGEFYPDLRRYQEYLKYYISEREKVSSGSGLNSKRSVKRSKSIKTKCKVQILGTPEEVRNKVKLNIASIKAGNTNNNLKTETIKMLDHLYTNKHLTTQAYKLLNNSIHQ